MCNCLCSVIVLCGMMMMMKGREKVKSINKYLIKPMNLKMLILRCGIKINSLSCINTLISRGRDGLKELNIVACFCDRQASEVEEDMTCLLNLHENFFRRTMYFFFWAVNESDLSCFW